MSGCWEMQVGCWVEGGISVLLVMTIVWMVVVVHFGRVARMMFLGGHGEEVVVHVVLCGVKIGWRRSIDLGRVMVVKGMIFELGDGYLYVNWGMSVYVRDLLGVIILAILPVL